MINKYPHSRYYNIGGIAIELKSDFPFTYETYADKLAHFQSGCDKDQNVAAVYSLDYSENIPEIEGEQICLSPPWEIFKHDNGFLYKIITTRNNKTCLLMKFDLNFKKGTIYKRGVYKQLFFKGNQRTLLGIPTDQLLWSRLLSEKDICADKPGIILHAAGIKIKGRVFLFSGHSGAGKTTIVKAFLNILRHSGLEPTVLNDDRIIIRISEDGKLVAYGTPWHGDLTMVSSEHAPLRAIYFLKKSSNNRICPMPAMDGFRRVYASTVHGFEDRNSLLNKSGVTEKIAASTKFYQLEFTKNLSEEIIMEIFGNEKEEREETDFNKDCYISHGHTY